MHGVQSPKSKVQSHRRDAMNAENYAGREHPAYVSKNNRKHCREKAQKAQKQTK